MKISVIIPFKNSAATIADQLDALTRQDWSGEWEVLLADNGGTDTTLSIIEPYKERLPGLRIITARERPGAPHARNIAARYAKGDFLAFCDSDDRVGDQWLSAFATALRDHEFVAGRLVVEEINPPSVIAMRPFILQTQREGLMNSLNFLPWAGAGTMAISRELFLEHGGFDEDLPALEDVDFSWRVQLAGKKLIFVPGAEIHYRLRSDLKAIFKQALQYSEHQIMVFRKFRKHGLQRPPFSLKSFLKGPNGWAALAKHFPGAVTSRERMGAWLWNCGWRVGKVTGSVKHRYPMLS